jgi:hypothetical protein
MPRSEACWHVCSRCRREFFHQVSEGAPLDTYFLPCQSCRPGLVVESKLTAPDKEIGREDGGGGDGFPLTGIGQSTYALEYEERPSEFEMLAVPEEIP